MLKEDHMCLTHCCAPFCAHKHTHTHTRTHTHMEEYADRNIIYFIHAQTHTDIHNVTYPILNTHTHDSLNKHTHTHKHTKIYMTYLIQHSLNTHTHDSLNKHTHSHSIHSSAVAECSQTDVLCL